MAISKSIWGNLKSLAGCEGLVSSGPLAFSSFAWALGDGWDPPFEKPRHSKAVRSATRVRGPSEVWGTAMLPWY